jgi:hypothetical protein
LAVGVKRDIHSISMIELESIMDDGLTIGTDRQGPAEGLKEEILNFRRIGNSPASVTVKAN